MSKIFCPKRAKSTTVGVGGAKADVVLELGEALFVEPPEGAGKGIGAIKIGDGSTAVSNLPMYIDGNISEVGVTVTTDTSSTATTAAGNVVTGKTVSSIVGSLKQAEALNAAAITTAQSTINSIKTNYPGWVS